MKMRNFLVSTITSALVVALASMAAAEGPGPVQQQPPQMQQQMPVGKPPPPPQGQQQQQPPQMQQHPGQQKPPAKPAKPGKPGKPKVVFIRVHRGDTLGKIAYRHHTSVARLKRLNHLKGDKILVGQRLRVR